MLNIVNKFRRIDRKGRISDDDRTEGASDLPLDKRVTFDPSPDEHWSFEDDGRIHLNDLDIMQLVDEERHDVRFLCGVSSGLHQYQLFVWGKGGKVMKDFNAQVAALQDKIHLRLGGIYDDLTGGIHPEVDDGELWVNNINVKKVLRLFYRNPSEKFRRYLMGIRDKLNLILSSRRSSSSYDVVYKQANMLFKDVNLALEYIPADAPPRLVSRDRHI